MRRRAWTAAAALAVAAPLCGFIRETTSTGVALFRTDAASVQTYVNTSIAPGAKNASGVVMITPTSNPMAAVAAAAATWSSIPTSTLRFATPQPTTLSNDPSDGKFVLTMQDTPTNRSVLGDALAITLTEFQADGAIYDTDILFNPNNTDLSTGAQLPWSTDHELYTYDLQSVATHEMGHAIGSDHSPVLSATMFQSTAYISPYVPVASVITQSRLSPDDIALATDAYPAASAAQQYGSITGHVMHGDGTPIVGALIGAVSTSTGTVIGGISSLSDGHYVLNRVPAGSYLVYAFPANGPVTTANLSVPNVNSANTNFRTSFAGGNAFPSTGSVQAGGTTSADIIVDATAPNLHIAYAAVGSPGGTDWAVGGVPQVVQSGTSEDILLWGNGLDATVQESQIRLLGPGVSLRAGSLRVQSNITFGSYPMAIRFTVDVAPRATTNVATLAIVNGTDATVYSGGIIMLGSGTVCTASLSTSTANFTAGGGAGSVTLTQPAGCTATVTSNASWITLTSGAAATASTSTVSFTVAANTATQTRTGTLTIAGQTFTVTQAAASAITSSSAPTVVTLSPAASSGSSQTLTFTFSSPSGYQSLDVENVLLNTALSSRQSCYLAYQRSTNVLYLVADSGDPTQVTGKLLGSFGTLGNSQCTVNTATSSATGSGNTLALKLDLTFTSSFAGNKVIYAATRDLSGGNSGWQTIGVHQVPGAAVTYPLPLSVSPASGSGLSQTFTFTFQDQTSGLNLQTGWALIRDNIDSSHACFVAYYRPGNLLYLYPDNGDGTQALSMPLSGTGTLSNSQCTISAQGALAQTSGSTLTVKLPITFSPTFAGNKGIWQAIQIMSGAHSDWQALGAWQVPAQ